MAHCWNLYTRWRPLELESWTTAEQPWLLPPRPPPPSTFDRRSLFPAKAGWPEGPPSHIFEPAAEAPLQMLLKDKRTPITTPPYQVPSVDVTPDPPFFSLVTTFNQNMHVASFFSPKSFQCWLQGERPLRNGWSSLLQNYLVSWCWDLQQNLVTRYRKSFRKKNYKMGRRENFEGNVLYEPPE